MWVEWEPHVNELGELDFFVYFALDLMNQSLYHDFFRSADTLV